MALYIDIESSRREWANGVKHVNVIQWHVGEPFPELLDQQRVSHFQADGDELELFKKAMRETRTPNMTVCSFHERDDVPSVWCVSMMVMSEDEDGTHYACAEHLETLMERLLDTGAGQFEVNWIGVGKIL